MLIFQRLLGFLKPYKRGVAWSFVLAFGAMVTTVLIPYLTGRAVDAISDHDRHRLAVWAIAIGVAGLARLGLSCAGRLTAEAEENISGVRVVKAFAQEERQLGRFRHSVARVFDQAIYATKIQAVYGPLISFLPNIGLGLILFVGGRQVIHGTLTLGAFT